MSCDAKFPPETLDKLTSLTGLDAEQLDNIMKLFSKSENDDLDWTLRERFGYCECLDYDAGKRGFTISTFGATTGGTEDGDADRLFAKFGTTKEALGYPDHDTFVASINALGGDLKWQAAVWDWFIDEYLQPVVEKLKQRDSNPSPLMLAAVLDTAFNQGLGDDQGLEWVWQQTLKKDVAADADDDTFLRAFLMVRATVAGDQKYCFNSCEHNGKHRCHQFLTLLDKGCSQLKECDQAVEEATSWEMK